MDESSAMRAIMIGAGLFISMITITAVLTYYNSAKNLVENVGTGTDVSANYSAYIKDLIVKPSGSTISGSEAKNILNYFFDDARTNVTVKLYTTFANDKKTSDKPIFNKSGLNKKENINDYQEALLGIKDNYIYTLDVSYYDGTEEVETIVITEKR